MAFCLAAAAMWSFAQDLTQTQRQMLNALVDVMQGQPEQCYPSSGNARTPGSDVIGPGAP